MFSLTGTYLRRLNALVHHEGIVDFAPVCTPFSLTGKYFVSSLTQVVHTWDLSLASLSVMVAAVMLPLSQACAGAVRTYCMDSI